MILRTASKYPINRAYVVKLSSDASPDAMSGRLENLVSGQHRDFSSAQELLQLMADDLTTAPDEPNAPEIL